MSENQPEPKKAGVHYWLDKFLKVELTDGRVIVGRLSCTDNAPNIIITQAEEYWKEEEPEPKNVRQVGMVMINGKYITKIFEINVPENPKTEISKAVT